MAYLLLLLSGAQEPGMNLNDLALAIEARFHHGGGNAASHVARVYAGVTMSDLIAHASSDTLIVTSLNNAQLARMAELMDVPGICLVNGAAPGPELLDAARRSGTAILVSPAGLEATRRALHEVLGA
jgi:hypothetical protein